MPTIREIAKKTGLSIATVSMALRGRGRMSKKTREQILAVAEALGYQAVPILSKAFSIVRQPKGAWYRETLALITEFPMASAPLYQVEIFRGASARAKERGYHLEPFHVSGKASEHRRLSRVLYTRGIRGLVILPRVEFSLPRLYLDWSKFAAVEIGRTLRSPRTLHRVERPIYYELIEALHLLKKVGYRRIGMAVEPTEDKHRIGIYTSAYLLSQERVPEKARIPTLASYGPWKEENFRNWLKEYKPDVIIVHTTMMLTWLKKLKMRVPGDVSVFCSNVAETNLTGLLANRPKLGESAVEMLSLLLEQDELGIPREARCWLVPDAWQAGDTLSRPIPIEDRKNLLNGP